MCFMKKSWGEKSRGTVPLIGTPYIYFLKSVTFFFSQGRGRKRTSSDNDSESEDEDYRQRQQQRNGHNSGSSAAVTAHCNGPSRKKLVTSTSASSPYATEAVGVPGIIEKVRLENFMCHSEFQWIPNSCVNFVTGANGSGKSSVLQGKLLWFIFPDLKSWRNGAE
jgi:hypothetical protein